MASTLGKNAITRLLHGAYPGQFTSAVLVLNMNQRLVPH